MRMGGVYLMSAKRCKGGFLVMEKKVKWLEFLEY
jgi:hypothetical protein